MAEETKLSDLKIVITIQGETSTVGLQKPDCDPLFFKRYHGGLAEALEELPLMVDEAKTNWQVRPRYPTTEVPPPAPAAPITASRPVASQMAKATTQQAMF
jgi:hypothetical protein